MNLLTNPEFANNGAGWKFHADQGGTFAVDGATAVLTVKAAGKNVQFYQSGLALEPATTYRLEFASSSSDGTPLSVMVHNHVAPYETYGLAQVVPLSGELDSYVYEFTTPGVAALNPARLRFWLVKAVAGTVFQISSPSLEVAPEAAPPPSYLPHQTVVVAREWEPGDTYEVRIVKPSEIVMAEGGIDWSVTPYQKVVYQA